MVAFNMSLSGRIVRWINRSLDGQQSDTAHDCGRWIQVLSFPKARDECQVSLARGVITHEGRSRKD
jgi:hypothetical protein